MLAEFGDDPHRYADPKSRKNYAGTSPITKASGTRRVVLTRVAVNKRLRDAPVPSSVRRVDMLPRARV